MKSKIFKDRRAPTVEISQDQISGMMLFRKLEAWCEANPLVLMWEVEHNEGLVKNFIDEEGKEQEYPWRNWRINFQIVRAQKTDNKRIFNGAIILAGHIEDSMKIVDGESREAYLLSLESRSVKGKQAYISATSLWKEITTLGS